MKERVSQWKATRNTRNNSLHRKCYARFMRVSYITALKNDRLESTVVVHKEEKYTHSIISGPKNCNNDSLCGLFSPIFRA